MPICMVFGVLNNHIIITIKLSKMKKIENDFKYTFSRSAFIGYTLTIFTIALIIGIIIGFNHDNF